MLRFCAWCALSAAFLLGCVPIRPSEVAAAGAGRATPDAAPAAARAPDEARAPDAAQEKFETLVLPILVERCSPCHFEGGKMYDRLPFDKPGTIRVLGTALFTRIRDEDERRAIRDFLGQSTPAPADAGTPADGQRPEDPPLPR